MQLKSIEAASMLRLFGGGAGAEQAAASRGKKVLHAQARKSYSQISISPIAARIRVADAEHAVRFRRVCHAVVPGVFARSFDRERSHKCYP
jgi:hypothetical protein